MSFEAVYCTRLYSNSNAPWMGDLQIAYRVDTDFERPERSRGRRAARRAKADEICGRELQTAPANHNYIFIIHLCN